MKTNQGRRSFIVKAATLLSATGLPFVDALEIANKLAKGHINQAGAASLFPRRFIEVLVRAGAPVLPFGAGAEFKNETSVKYPNCPYVGSALTNMGNNLFMSNLAEDLKPYAENMAVTQGVTTENGHTGMFAIREGGLGKKKISPIIELAQKNTSVSTLGGVQFGGGVNNSIGNLADLTRVSTSSFISTFKQPKLHVSADELGLIARAAQKLSRRQALRYEERVKGAISLTDPQQKAVQLFSVDVGRDLSISDLDQKLITGSSNIYRDFGQGLAYTVKAMGLNLINSSVVALNTSDWHGSQNTQKSITYGTEVSQKLGELIKLLKATPEPAGDGSTSLWDTTHIMVSSEFTRGLSRLNSNNFDGGSQGFLLIGKKIRGGYYGGFDLSGGGNGVQYGFDINTGVATPGATVETASVHETVRTLLGLGTDQPDKVIKTIFL